MVSGDSIDTSLPAWSEACVSALSFRPAREQGRSQKRGVTSRPAHGFVSYLPRGSAARTATPGLRPLTAVATPEIMPPPDMGTITASSSLLVCSISSSPRVPCTAVLRPAPSEVSSETAGSCLAGHDVPVVEGRDEGGPSGVLNALAGGLARRHVRLAEGELAAVRSDGIQLALRDKGPEHEVTAHAEQRTHTFGVVSGHTCRGARSVCCSLSACDNRLRSRSARRCPGWWPRGPARLRGCLCSIECDHSVLLGQACKQPAPHLTSA